MVAVLVPTPTAPSTSIGQADRLGGSTRSARPSRPDVDAPIVVSRPVLRVIDGGRAPRRAAIGAPSAGVYLRRRILAAVAAVVVLVVLVVGVQAAASLLAAPSAPATSSATVSAVPIAADTYVVRPGDTLWSIAARLDPGSDPRPLVEALRARSGGASLEAGQRIDVSGLGA